MSRLGFNSSTKSVVFHGEARLGELDVIPVTDANFQFPNNEIRIHHISPLSERCPPLSILQTISSYSVRCKLESSSPNEQSHLINLHASCFHESKTAVVLLGDEEIHLVAMPSKQKKFPCFWCYSAPLGLYNSSLGLLNMRCLAIVFDLDETLIMANTMKSFEDRIEALRGWITRENDPIRLSGMSAELMRYVDDRALLKQYCESDYVMDNGKMYKVQMEEVPKLSDSHEKLVRPIIRLPDKNIVLTRINPEIRDTSVLVRLRPAWEELRNYLTAKGRKRFEVYVCTMAERDYALEIWRLLDPEAHLISSAQLLNRVVCVKSGSKKSLLNVFQDGTCHPKMAMVIDDRSKVWEERDQPRVHVVPPFTPYYAPQAETANIVPVLCVARNVACNVRGYFFKEFDENLLRKIAEISYEDEVASLPSAPDVSNYLMAEDTGFVQNGTANAPIAEGMHGAEVNKRLNQEVDDHRTNNSDLRSESSQPSVMVIANATCPSSLRTLLPSQKPGLLGTPARQDFIFVDRDLDLKRKILSGRNPVSSEPPLLSRPPIQLPTAVILPQAGLLVEEEKNKGQMLNRPSNISQESDASKLENQRTLQSPSSHSTPNVSSLPRPKPDESTAGYDQHIANVSSRGQSSAQLNASSVFGEDKFSYNAVTPILTKSGLGASQSPVHSNDRDLQAEGGKLNILQSSLSIGVLQEIGRRCCSKVEFRSVVSTSKDLQFSVEVLFTGEKIGVGMGKTRKDAQQQAAVNALQTLADQYVAFASSQSKALDGTSNNHSLENENGFLWDATSPQSKELKKDVLS